MSVEVVPDGEKVIRDGDKKSLKKIIDGCKSCSKFKKLAFSEGENSRSWMSWIFCSRGEKQRVRTCASCMLNEYNIYGKKKMKEVKKFRRE